MTLGSTKIQRYHTSVPSHPLFPSPTFWFLSAMHLVHNVASPVYLCMK